VQLSINIDQDLYTSIQAVAEHTSIPPSRVINAILRAYHGADYAALDLGFSPSYHGYTTIKNAWPLRPPYTIETNVMGIVEEEETAANNDL